MTSSQIELHSSRTAYILTYSLRTCRLVATSSLAEVYSRHFPFRFHFHTPGVLTIWNRKRRSNWKSRFVPSHPTHAASSTICQPYSCTEDLKPLPRLVSATLSQKDEKFLVALRGTQKAGNRIHSHLKAGVLTIALKRLQMTPTLWLCLLPLCLELLKSTENLWFS